MTAEPSPSLMTDEHRVLVLDASAAINILGSGRPLDLLRALDRQILIEETALREVKRDPVTGQPADGVIQSLTSMGALQVTTMSGPTFNDFLGMVGAHPPDDLGDGEAATIAYAIEIGAVAVIDDKKAIRIASQKNPLVPVLQSFDLFVSELLRHQLGEVAVSDLLYSALKHARMRVPKSHHAWTIELLGEDRAINCPSLISVEKAVTLAKTAT